jgi:hypothetical protein
VVPRAENIENANRRNEIQPPEVDGAYAQRQPFNDNQYSRNEPPVQSF